MRATKHEIVKYGPKVAWNVKVLWDVKYGKACIIEGSLLLIL